ncbi:GNAT family N-acetyltransferase [Brevibacillus fluminis]|uniref:GNAT family N-acetyltransferase n=1 Tax=Brevibacillus fluminis TaxID=511487 RepID=UPI003F88B744
MIRMPEKKDALKLFEYLLNPAVGMYSRIKPASPEELWFSLMEKREAADSIVRVIVDDADEPVGFIAIWNYNRFAREGFLATIIAEEHWGKGYNQRAKAAFLAEVFRQGLECAIVLVRKTNPRSLKAVSKLPYACAMPVEERTRLQNLYAGITDEHEIFGIYRDVFERVQAEMPDSAYPVLPVLEN